MIEVMVFNKGVMVGTFTVPKPLKDESICLYKKWSSKSDEYMNILYFRDMDYGILISDEAAKYFDDLEERI